LLINDVKLLQFLCHARDGVTRRKNCKSFTSLINNHPNPGET